MPACHTPTLPLLVSQVYYCLRQSVTRRAWRERAEREEKMLLARGCTTSDGESFIDGGVSCRAWLVRERALPTQTTEAAWANFLMEINQLPKSQDIVRVSLGKTMDSHTWVIRLTDPDGKTMSYWLDSGSDTGGNVNDISAY